MERKSFSTTSLNALCIYDFVLRSLLRVLVAFNFCNFVIHLCFKIFTNITYTRVLLLEANTAIAADISDKTSPGTC